MRLISSLMMPACTGLPPGELISSTMPLAPSSSKAVFIAATTNSALASAPAAISPLISITAVCGVALAVAGVPRDIANQSRKTKKASQLRRTKVFQRRVARCSRSEAKASFSSVARSHPAMRRIVLAMFCAAAERRRVRSKGSKPRAPCGGNRSCQKRRVGGSRQYASAPRRPVRSGDLHQAAAAGPAGAFAGVGL
jgi:hypothetical protein